MARKCIFCGEEGKLSKEHLWPDWLGKMYLRTGDEKHTFGSQSSADKTLVRDGVYERPGHLFSLKIKVVCQTCNNGWMSQVENDTKPILLNLINGQKFKITKAEIEALAFWVALKVVTAEFAEKKESLYVTPFEERQEMMNKRKIPSFFNIFVSGHSIGHNSAWLRNSWTMAFSPKGPTPAMEGRHRNAQSIAFVVGPIFFYVLNVRLLGFIPEQHFNFGNLKKIWPSKMTFLRWPQKPLTKLETDVLAYMALDLIESDTVNYVPEMPS